MEDNPNDINPYKPNLPRKKVSLKDTNAPCVGSPVVPEGVNPVAEGKPDRRCGAQNPPPLPPKHSPKPSAPASTTPGPESEPSSTKNTPSASMSSLMVGVPKRPDQHKKSQTEHQQDALDDIF